MNWESIFRLPFTKRELHSFGGLRREDLKHQTPAYNVSHVVIRKKISCAKTLLCLEKRSSFTITCVMSSE